MKKSIFFAALFIAALSFTSCEDETNGGSLKIDAKVVNGNDYNDLIDEVRVITMHVICEVPPTEVVSCDYKNGGFSLTLPKKVIESAYTFINNGQTAMTNNIHANFYAYKNNECVGEFVYCSSDSEYFIVYYYAFKNGVAILRVSEYDMGIEVILKKGWNTAYNGMSLQKPNVDFNWHFIPIKTL